LIGLRIRDGVILLTVLVLVLGALGARGDRSQLPVALAAVKSPNASIKRAGIQAVGRLGDASVVGLLVETTFAGGSLGAQALNEAVPQAMAYAQIAGLPPQYGLYTAIVMTAVGVPVQGTRHLSACGGIQKNTNISFVAGRTTPGSNGHGHVPMPRLHRART